MENKRTDLINKSDNKDKNAGTSRQLFVIKIIMIVFFLTGVVGIIVSQIVLPREGDDSVFFCDKFEPQWTQVMEDGTKKAVDVSERLEGEYGSEFVIETKVTARLAAYGYLCVKSMRQDVKIFVENKLRASYSTKDTRLYGNSSPGYYVFAKFSAQDEGKVLTITLQTQSDYSGLVKNMYYGSQAGIWMELVRNEGLELFVGIIMFLLAFICVIVSLILRFAYKRKDPKGDLLYLGLTEMLAGIWVICNSAFRQMVFPNISSIADMTFFALMLLPLPLMIFMNQVQEGRYYKAYFVASIITIIDTVVCSLLALTDTVNYQRSFVAIFSVLFLTVLLLAVTMIIDVRKKRANSYIHIIIGIIGTIICGVLTMIIYLTRSSQTGAALMCFGFIFLLIMAIIRLLRNAVTTENERLEAVRANRMQEEFLANMSHEIRTPLNAIIGLNEMVIKESTEGNVKQYAADIKGASKTLLGLINDILDFSKIESGKVDMTPVKYWTAFLLTDSYNLISGRAKERNVEMKVEADPTVPEQLYGDETRIRQIITNLLTNAVKYTNEGTITLKLSWRKTSIETALMRISVADTGIGIKPEDQERLFQSFSRVDEKKNRNIEGTGLGLVICRQLVELMDGKIWVKSEYGKGSEFFVEIPQKIVSEKGMGEFSPHTNLADEETISASTDFTAPDARVLVVDDVEMNLKVIKNLLKDTQVTLETAMSGQECLDMTKNTGYDLIFLDHRMPEMDGIETFRLMKERENDPNEDTPVIMLTANVVAGARENYINEGFVDYLTKPIKQSELKQAMIDYLPLHKVKR